MIGEIGFLGHHVTHGTWFKRRQLASFECSLVSVDDLSSRFPRQHHLCPLVSSRQNGSRGRRVEADWAANLRVPKLPSIGRGHPATFDQAYKSILAFDGCFIAMAT